MTEFTEHFISSINKIKDWLNEREPLNFEETAFVEPPESLSSIGFTQFHIEKFDLVHNDRFIYCHDLETNERKKWTTINHLYDWTSKFLTALRAHKEQLATLELLRGNKEVTISLANFYVTEAISIVQSTLTCDVSLDLCHPETTGNSYAVENVLVEDTTAVHDIVRQVCMCLFSQCAVRLVVKLGNYYSSLLTAYLVDMMIKSGATPDEVKLLLFNKRESLGSERLSKCVHSNKSTKLSTIAIVFARTDTFAAAHGILESYFQQQYPNLIVLVEEAAYDTFILDWQRYYSHALVIGSRLDGKTTVSDELNSKVKVDLAAIDIKTAHKTTGNVINFLRFRSLADLISLLNNLRKVPIMSLWHDDTLLLRDLCNDINCCSQFWFRHIPRSCNGRKFEWDILDFYADYFSEFVTNTYNNVNALYNQEIDALRKQQVAFAKKDPKLRVQLVMSAYVSALTNCKSLRNGRTLNECKVQLARFFKGLHLLQELDAGDSRVEVLLKPIGLAIVNVLKNDSGDASGTNSSAGSQKFKAALTDLIFKNLLLGNAVLLCCPQNILGAKFALEHDHMIPFRMVTNNEDLPDLSRLSLQSTMSEAALGQSKKQCPKNTYAIEFTPKLTQEKIEALVVALGTKRKSFWFPDSIQTNYWTDD